MRKVFITLAASLAVGWFLASNGQLTFLLPGSQLGFLETMRRSPELRANFEKFQTCYKSTPRCDTTAIFAERDRLVKQLWPEILNRLEVAQDWDVCDDPALHCESINVERDTFFQVQARLGSVMLQKDCVLVVRYLARQDFHGDEDPRLVFDSGGYQCGTANFPYDWEKARYNKRP
jgi:hypothetical protein